MQAVCAAWAQLRLTSQWRLPLERGEMSYLSPPSRGGGFTSEKRYFWRRNSSLLWVVALEFGQGEEDLRPGKGGCWEVISKQAHTTDLGVKLLPSSPALEWGVKGGLFRAPSLLR